jgi:hypothetical protein
VHIFAISGQGTGLYKMIERRNIKFLKPIQSLVSLHLVGVLG